MEDGRSIEVIDLRSISPLDVPTVAASVAKTGRLIIAHEAPTFGGMGGELAAAITERCFYSLQAPVIRVGGYYMPYPVSRVEEEYVPDIDRILEASTVLLTTSHSLSISVLRYGGLQART